MSIVELLPAAATLSLSLDAFLAGVERRAYRMALLATRQPTDALDLVQESMLKLVEHYRRREAHEWPALFQRILQNAILDWHRRQGRRRRWFGFAPAALQDDVDDEDPLAQIEIPVPATRLSYWHVPTMSRRCCGFSNSCRCASSRRSCCASGKDSMSPGPRR